MKLFLPVAILFFAFGVPAVSQITITQADMPQPGDTLRASITVDSAGLPSSVMTGAGITWNYSALVAQQQTVDTFLSVASTPLLYQLYFNDAILYPDYKSTVAQAGADFPAVGSLVSNVINFYKAEPANYEGVGYGAKIDAVPASVKDDNIDVIYTFPMKYGNADSCHSGNHTNIPTFGYYELKQYRINHVQGWGTLITPYGTFSTLKVQTIIYSSDSIYLDTLHLGFKTPQTEQIQYEWLANGQHIPVLQINITPGSKTNQYIYRDSIRHSLGTADIASVANNIVVYPNPGNGLFQLGIKNEELGSNPPGRTIEVYNILGEKVYSNYQITKLSNYQINLSSQPPGVYFLKIESNGVQVTKKLVVVR